VALVPRSAVQNVGERQVVYLEIAGQPGQFVEREVQLGRGSGDQVEVIAGVKPGDHVVSNGSFFVRAERERLGLPTASSPPTAGASRSTNTSDTALEQTAKITVG